MKKIVIFGGGTGMSQLLKGLKCFPFDITTVVSVFDNGRSTGKLREVYDIPAVGDITKILVTIGNLDEEVTKLLNYRAKGTNDKNGYDHSIKNLILASLIDINGSFEAGITSFCHLFNINSSVLPITEENVNLVAKTDDGQVIKGEDNITEAQKKVVAIWYDKKFKPNPKVIKAVEKADAIIFSAGSLYTSILPHLMIPEVTNAIKKAKAQKLYISNLITQPGETMDFAVSDHLKILCKYLGKNGLDAVIANNAKISKRLADKYETREQKYPVLYDEDKIKEMKIKPIADKLYKIEDNMIRHDSIKTAYLVYSYLMGDK